MANWFDVDKEGLKELQLGKPKHYVIRELVQNAWDEDIKECKVTLEYHKEGSIIIVEDDNPIGFRDLNDSFTLFKHTYKRADPTKRGRFNLGEKQAFAICDKAKIETTKGTVLFDEEGRHISDNKTKQGSKVSVYLKLTKEEFEEMLYFVERYIVPPSIRFNVNGKILPHSVPYKVVSACLKTEKEENGVLKPTVRKTDIHIYTKGDVSFLYEMGIPVMEIDCDYSIDVQQKIPLSADRESVPPSYLKDVYTQVLNVTYENVNENNASSSWVRLATTGKEILKEAVESVIKNRFGDKAVIANPFDRVSVDDALANGYKVISGSEMSKEEWGNVKEFGILQSSSEVFGREWVTALPVLFLTPEQKKLKELTKKISKKTLGFEVSVKFVKCTDTNELANYGNREVTFNLGRINGDILSNVEKNGRAYSLIIHELGHEKGMHTESSYHEALTEMAGSLIIEALNNPPFFLK